jgi:hypothetical protein
MKSIEKCNPAVSCLHGNSWLAVTTRGKCIELVLYQPMQNPASQPAASQPGGAGADSQSKLCWGRPVQGKHVAAVVVRLRSGTRQPADFRIGTEVRDAAEADHTAVADPEEHSAYHLQHRRCSVRGLYLPLARSAAHHQAWMCREGGSAATGPSPVCDTPP